jgi:Anti-sigma-K factor rskA
MLVLPPPLTVRIEGNQHRHFPWAPLWGVVAIASLAMALFAASFFRGRERDLAQQLGRAREQLRTQTLELTASNEALAILKRPDTAVVPFGQTGSPAPVGKVFVNPSQGILLLASNLPAPPSGKLYEMWLVPRRGMPAAAGLFQPAMDETALHLGRGPVDIGATAAVTVTLENAAGASQPTSQPLLIARLDARQ